MTIDELTQFPEVQRWLSRVGRGDVSPADREVLLAELREFCGHTEKTPTELVTSCLRTTDQGLLKIRIKGRRAMQEAIDDYVAARALSGHEAIAAGNRIRGFLVHNGVFIQGRASIR